MHFLGVAAITALLGTPAFSSEYEVGPGDVLSLRFIGGVATVFEVPVEANGSAWFPVVGALDVSGSSLDAVRARISDAYAGTRMANGADGTESLVDPSHIFVGVAKYRPVYVDGPLGQAVVVEYRPGLTLRQALVSAKAQQPFIAGQSQTNRMTNLASDMAQVEARIWRLRAMLTQEGAQSFEDTFDGRPANVRRLANLERATLNALETEQQTALDAVTDQTSRAQSRLASLLEQLTYEEEVRAQDDDVVENLRDLSERGLTPTARIADARRAALTSATRVLQLNVEIETARARIEELTQEAASLQTGNVSRIRTELTEQIAQYQRLSAELAVSQGAAATSDAASQAVQSVQILRANGERIDAPFTSTTFVLMPGDVVEVVAEGSASLEIEDEKAERDHAN